MSRIFSSFVLSLLFAATTVTYAGRGALSAKQDLAGRHVDDVQIEAQGLGSLLEKFSLGYDIPIGFEAAANDDERAIYQLNSKRASLSDLLNEFVSQHEQYVWEIRGGVVNIFPKDNYRDALFRDLLATRIDKFVVKKSTSCLELSKSLAATPEVKGILTAYATSYGERSFSGSYFPQVGRDFALDVSNMTLQAALNRVIKESPSARFWLVTRNRSDQTLWLNLSARADGFPERSSEH
jgi:hypothetical protein